MSGEEDPACEITGLCEGQRSARPCGVCSCTHCGKELHWRDDAWWTWDAPDREVRRPQTEDDRA